MARNFRNNRATFLRRILEAVEAGKGALCRVAEAGCGQRPGRPNGRECSRPVATGEQPGPRHRTAQCLLRLAWASQIDCRSIAQPGAPPYTDPYVRWCDRERW